jgi:hypothetical protein
MVRSNLTRRDFTKLAAAALGGVVTGTMIGCGDKKSDSKSSAGSDTKGGSGEAGAKTDEGFLLTGKHVCKGLNMCMNKGKSGKNDCAGQGTCHSAAEHTCHKKNDCKGEGGCGATAGINACKTQGGCDVPLKPDTWKKVRAKFETVYEAKNSKKVGAPA